MQDHAVRPGQCRTPQGDQLPGESFRPSCGVHNGDVIIVGERTVTDIDPDPRGGESFGVGLHAGIVEIQKE